MLKNVNAFCDGNGVQPNGLCPCKCAPGASQHVLATGTTKCPRVHPTTFSRCHQDLHRNVNTPTTDYEKGNTGYRTNRYSCVWRSNPGPETFVYGKHPITNRKRPNNFEAPFLSTPRQNRISADTTVPRTKTGWTLHGSYIAARLQRSPP